MIEELAPKEGLRTHAVRWAGTNRDEIIQAIAQYGQGARVVKPDGLIRLWVIREESGPFEVPLGHFINIYPDGYVGVMSPSIYQRQWQRTAAWGS